jgi:small subunit ribosomal protein S2
MTQLPTVAIVVDPVRENTAVQELRKLKIPIISISDTNADPRLSKFPIVTNIASKESIEILLAELATWACRGKTDA